MNNLKNMSNKLKSVVGLRTAQVNEDLNESLLSEYGTEQESVTSSVPYGSAGNRSTQEIESLRASALDRQQSNNQRFQDHLRREEEQIYNEIRLRRSIEEEDRKLAELLQEQDGIRQRNIKVTVPNGIYGGQILNVALPDGSSRNVQVPPNLGPGDTFVITTAASSSVPNTRYTSARVPEGVAAGGSFNVALPNGTSIKVTVPDGVAPGDELVVPYIMDTSEEQKQIPYEEVLNSMTNEERGFLESLPPDLHSDAIEQKRQEMLSRITPSSRQTKTGTQHVQIVQVEVPAGVTSGQEFRVVMPDGRAIMVMVPPGVQPGEKIGLPADAGIDEQSQTREDDATESTTTKVDQKARAEFLAALPPELRDEVLANESRMEAELKSSEIKAESNKELLLDFSRAGGDSDEKEVINKTGELGLIESEASEVSNKELLSQSHDYLTPRTPTKDPIESVGDLLTSGEDSTRSDNILPPQVEQAPTGALKREESVQTPSQNIAAKPKTPLERLREAKLGLEQGKISQEEFNRIKQEVIQAL